MPTVEKTLSFFNFSQLMQEKIDLNEIFSSDQLISELSDENVISKFRKFLDEEN